MKAQETLKVPFLLRQLVALLLTLPLSLPPSAYALRPSSVEGAGLEELKRELSPAAGMEELGQAFKEKYLIQRVEDPARLRIVMETLIGAGDKSLDKHLRVVDYFIQRLDEFRGGDLSRFLPEETDRRAMAELEKAAKGQRWDQEYVLGRLSQPEARTIVDQVSQLTGFPPSSYRSLWQRRSGLTVLEQHRREEYATYLSELNQFFRHRGYAQRLSDLLETSRQRWHTPAVRDRFIPMALNALFTPLSRATDGKPSRVADEVSVLRALAKEAGLGSVRFVTPQERERTAFWPKDQSVLLPGFAGIVRLRTPPAVKPLYDVFHPESYPLADFSEGGAFVSGVAKTPFMLYADDVESQVVEGAKAVLPEIFPGLSGLSFYRLPGGFTTYRYQGRELLIGNRHLDTVLGFIPPEATSDGKAKLLVDPLYLRELEGLDEFERFKNEQGKDIEIVEVEEAERHYNPANVVYVFPGGQLKLVMNYAPRTIEKLRLDPVKYYAIQREEYALWRIANAGGGLGCLCGVELAEPIPTTDSQPQSGAGMEEAVPVEELPARIRGLVDPLLESLRGKPASEARVNLTLRNEGIPGSPSATLSIPAQMGVSSREELIRRHLGYVGIVAGGWRIQVRKLFGEEPTAVPQLAIGLTLASAGIEEIPVVDLEDYLPGHEANEVRIYIARAPDADGQIWWLKEFKVFGVQERHVIRYVELLNRLRQEIAVPGVEIVPASLMSSTDGRLLVRVPFVKGESFFDLFDRSGAGEVSDAFMSDLDRETMRLFDAAQRFLDEVDNQTGGLSDRHLDGFGRRFPMGDLNNFVVPQEYLKEGQLDPGKIGQIQLQQIGPISMARLIEQMGAEASAGLEEGAVPGYGIVFDGLTSVGAEGVRVATDFFSPELVLPALEEGRQRLVTPEAGLQDTGRVYLGPGIQLAADVTEALRGRLGFLPGDPTESKQVLAAAGDVQMAILDVPHGEEDRWVPRGLPTINLPVAEATKLTIPQLAGLEQAARRQGIVRINRVFRREWKDPVDVFDLAA